MKLNFITFMVRNIQNSMAFYQRLAGLQVVNRIGLERGEIVFLANAKGETMLELVALEGAEPVTAKGMFMSFTAGDRLDEIRERAISLGYAPSDIIAIGPKPKHFSVMDPDGVSVEFSV